MFALAATMRMSIRCSECSSYWLDVVDSFQSCENLIKIFECNLQDFTSNLVYGASNPIWAKNSEFRRVGRIFVRQMAVIVFCLFLLTTAGSAQIPTKGNIFFGYSYVSADTNLNDRANLNGWNGSLEGKVFPWVGIVADISGHYGSQDVPVLCPAPACSVTADASVHSFLFGPRVSVSIGRIRPFAHALFGAAHTSVSALGGSDSDTSFATALGGGLDYQLVHGLGWRVQGDMLQTRFFSDTQNNFRLSTGIVLNF